MSAKPGSRFTVIFALLVAASLLPWLVIQLQQSVNVDNAWLTIAAMRFLDGQKMSEAFYDPNPPLSVLAYLVPAILVKYTGLALPGTLFSYSLMLVLASTYALWLILNKTGFITGHALPLFTALWLLLNTVLTGHFLGERDHYIILALLPFVLIQAGITFEKPLPRKAKIAVLVAGSIALMLKPHYGIVPVALIVHRAIVDRAIHLRRYPDALAMACAALIYAIIIALFCHDYLTVILPDALALYVTEKSDYVLPLSAAGFILTGAFALVTQLLLERKRGLILSLFALSALLILPFLVQGKGFFYHAIPFAVVLLCSFGLLLNRLLLALSGRFTSIAPVASSLATYLLIIVFVYYIFTPNRLYPTHEDYRQSELAALINSECPEDCRFFMFQDMTEMVHQLAVYTRTEHGSRFPSYWFVPGLLAAEDPALSAKYRELVAEDFASYRPDLLLIGEFTIDGQPFDFRSFFSGSFWNSYTEEGSITVERGTYFGGTTYNADTITYQIYKRIPA